MTAKTTTQRVTAMRQRRAESGLVRLDVYAHPSDHPAIKALAEKLQRERAATVTKKQYRVPATFWDDHCERAPCDHPDEMADEVSRSGSRVLIEGSPRQIECLRSDAAFYAGGNVDDCTGLIRSAAATLRALT